MKEFEYGVVHKVVGVGYDMDRDFLIVYTGMELSPGNISIKINFVRFIPLRRLSIFLSFSHIFFLSLAHTHTLYY